MQVMHTAPSLLGNGDLPWAERFTQAKTGFGKRSDAISLIADVSYEDAASAYAEFTVFRAWLTEATRPRR